MVSGEQVPGRTVTVPARRLVPWVRGFAQRHGTLAASTFTGGFMLRAADGAVARVSAPSAAVPLPSWPHDHGPDMLVAEVLAAEVADHLLAEREIALLVVRRGGYAAVRLRGVRVVSSKVGSRYVQGRTAAGGWSQQRFARRRDNQTGALVRAAVEVASRFLVASTPPAEILVTGGDRILVGRVLDDPRLRVLTGLPRGPHLALGDPRVEVIRLAPGLLSAARIGVHEPRSYT